MVTRSIIILFLSLGLLLSCVKPKTVVETDEYHQSVPEKTQSQPLNSLQLKALQLMNQQQYDSSIQYLQRAIKIQPRNPLNWHYLAQNYWFKQEYSRCRDMIQRARSYSQFDEDLERANHELFKQCSP